MYQRTLTPVFHICINQYSRLDHKVWIFNKASEKRDEQIKTRAKLFYDGYFTMCFFFHAFLWFQYYDKLVYWQSRLNNIEILYNVCRKIRLAYLRLYIAWSNIIAVLFAFTIKCPRLHKLPLSILGLNFRSVIR